MFNFEAKTVTCDTCGRSVTTDCARRTEAIRDVEQDGWKYRGVGDFACPKCLEENETTA